MGSQQFICDRSVQRSRLFIVLRQTSCGCEQKSLIQKMPRPVQWGDFVGLMPEMEEQPDLKFRLPALLKCRQ
ncbi:hypothetical protein D4R75_13300 [bacterium]|nr:MAG: hypothetical protein D4R75_13300 [bacterium]